MGSAIAGPCVYAEEDALADLEYHRQKDLDFWQYRQKSLERLTARSCPPEELHAKATCALIQMDSWDQLHQDHIASEGFRERKFILRDFPMLAGVGRPHEEDRDNYVPSGQEDDLPWPASGRVPVRILEIGCGSGATCLPILRANKAAHVTACDFSEQAVRLCRQTIETQLPADLNRFDSVTCDATELPASEYVDEATTACTHECA